MNLTKLYIAIKNGNLDEVIRLIQEGTDLNQPHPTESYSLLGYAAKHGHIEIVDYLYLHGCPLNTGINSKNVLLAMCQCEEPLKRQTLLNWLIMEDRYKKLGDNIDINHINAALGNSYDANCFIQHGGLLPVHYAILVGNQQIITNAAEILNIPLSKGRFSGATLAWLFSAWGHLDTLDALKKKHSIAINLNAEPSSDNLDVLQNQGITLALILCFYGRTDLLLAWSESSEFINLNATSQDINHIDMGSSPAWCLASANEFDVLNSLFMRNPQPIDLNKGPTHDKNLSNGQTLAWLLALKEKWDLLEKWSGIDNATSVYLNAAPLHNKHINKGLTLAWLLASYKKWDLLEKLWSHNPTIVDLNAAPLHDEYPHKGITLAMMLIANEQWSLLKKFLATYQKDEKVLELLNELLTNHSQPNHTAFRDLIHLEYINYYEQEISAILLTSSQFKSEERQSILKRKLKLFNNKINEIAHDSPYYKDAQSKKGHVLLLLRNHTTLVTDTLGQREKRASYLYALNPRSHSFIEIIAAFTQAGDESMVRALLAEEFNNHEKLERSCNDNRLTTRNGINKTLKNSYAIRFFNLENARLHKRIGHSNHVTERIEAMKKEKNDYVRDACIVSL